MYRVPQLYLRPSGVTAMISILVLRAISRFKVLAEVKLPYDKDLTMRKMIRAVGHD